MELGSVKIFLKSGGWHVGESVKNGGGAGKIFF